MSLLAVAASVALAMAPEAAAPPTQAAMPVAKVNPVVCRVESVPGSRIGAFHVCMRQSEWDARSNEAREYLTAMTNRSETLRP